MSIHDGQLEGYEQCVHAVLEACDKQSQRHYMNADEMQESINGVAYNMIKAITEHYLRVVTKKEQL